MNNCVIYVIIGILIILFLYCIISSKKEYLPLGCHGLGKGNCQFEAYCKWKNGSCKWPWE